MTPTNAASGCAPTSRRPLTKKVGGVCHTESATFGDILLHGVLITPTAEALLEGHHVEADLPGIRCQLLCADLGCIRV
jgi:hypothetical protein